MNRMVLAALVALLPMATAAGCGSILPGAPVPTEQPTTEASSTPFSCMADEVDEQAGLYHGEVAELVIGEGEMYIETYEDNTATVEIVVDDAFIDAFITATGESADLIVTDEMGRYMAISGIAARSMMSEEARQQILTLTEGFCPVGYLLSSYVDVQLDTISA